MSNSDIEQTGTVKGHIPNRANLSGRISNVVSLSGNISIGSVAGDFIIKMTIEVNGNNYTVTSCDKTMEQIDAAVASGQNIKAIAFDKYVMPMIQMEYSESYTFGAFLGSFLVAANVTKNPESGTDDWQFYLVPLTADIVEYSNASMPRISTVGDALDALVTKSHTHSNKSVLDKFSETDGKPTYGGEALGRDFVIKMTVTSDDNGNYTVTSCDATVEKIDAAVANEKRVVLIATDTDNNLSWDMPIVQGFNGSNYYFATFLLGQVILSFVQKVGENQARWQFIVRQIGSDFISYSNDALPNMSTVQEALDELVPNSHTHSNKLVLDKFSETDGKPTYDGKKISGASTAEEVEYTNAILPDASNVKSALDDTIDTQQTQSADLESLRAGVSALINAYETQGGDIASLKTQAHTHTNKTVLDKFAESDGKPTYGGEALGGGASDFVIKMMVEGDDDGYTVTSCDTTVEQIDAAVSAEKRVVVIASLDGIIINLPMLQGVKDNFYYFGAFVRGYTMISFVQKIDESTSEWKVETNKIQSGDVDYSNAAMLNISTVEGALDALVTNSHTHANKDTLDKLSVTDGKLQYNGSDVGLKGDKGDTPVKGTDYWTESDKAEIVNDTLAALPTWTGGSY